MYYVYYIIGFLCLLKITITLSQAIVTPNWLNANGYVTNVITATDTLLTISVDVDNERFMRVPICLDECAD